jgi:hypothetical protein
MYGSKKGQSYWLFFVLPIYSVNQLKQTKANKSKQKQTKANKKYKQYSTEYALPIS